jgi:hypothetical protein
VQVAVGLVGPEVTLTPMVMVAPDLRLQFQDHALFTLVAVAAATTTQQMGLAL